MRGVPASSILRDIQWWRCSEEARSLARRYGYLDYMVCRYEQLLGIEGTLRLLETFEKFRPRVTIRVNTLRSSVSKVRRRLEELGFHLRPLDWCDYCLEVVRAPSYPSVGATHEYLKGLYFVYRDPAPTIPPIVLDPRPSSITVDICAAPGGKATHALQLMRDRGLLLANDKARSRIPILVSHFARLGMTSYIVTRVDARDLPRLTEMRFDYVIADVPCSAEGGIMFDPSRKTKTTVDELAKLVAREIELLASAIELAKPGGRVVYSTCSIAPEENEYVVSRVLEMFRDVKIVNARIAIGSRGIQAIPNLSLSAEVSKCVRIWPHEHFMQGFFVCLLEKQ